MIRKRKEIIKIKRYIAKRILQLIPILIGITILSFGLMRLSSVDAVDKIYEDGAAAASEQSKEALREELGLNDPFPVQYFNWIKGIAKGNLGTSYILKKPVINEFLDRLPQTLLLSLCTIIETILLSVPLGVLCAVRKGKITDYIIRFACFIGNSMPGFFVALIFLYVFSLKLNLFPVISNGHGIEDMILPSLTLALAMSAKYIRQIRAAVLEELDKEYVTGLKSRGVSNNRILYVSVLKCAFLTIITLLGMSIGSLLGGTAIVETIFMVNGVGKMGIDAIMKMDYPMIQAYVIWMAVIFVLINLITDIIYNYLDPRIRLNKDVW